MIKTQPFGVSDSDHKKIIVFPEIVSRFDHFFYPFNSVINNGWKGKIHVGSNSYNN